MIFYKKLGKVKVTRYTQGKISIGFNVEEMEG